MGLNYSPPLELINWYEGGHLPGVHIWSPPPAATLEALKQLAKSRLKRPFDVSHVVLIQRLLYQEEWRRIFEKEMDFWFVLKPGTVWPNSAFEPLLVGISFKLSRTQLWLVRQQRDQVVEAGHRLYVTIKPPTSRELLAKLWILPWPFPSL